MSLPVRVMVLTALMVASCASVSGTGAAPSTSSPSTATVTSSPPPPGGPIPAELRGKWSMVDGYAPGQKLTLTADAFYFIQARGSAVVNGDEIDIFHSPGCMENLGYDAVGRYRWTLVGTVLFFKALNADPCERKEIFNDVHFELVKN